MNVDCFGPYVSEGDIVSGLFVYEDGELEDEVDYLVLGIEKRSGDFSLVTLGYSASEPLLSDLRGDADLDYELEQVVLEMREGTPFVMNCDRIQSSFEGFDGIYFQPHESKFKLRPTTDLVKVGSRASRSDVEAKFDAYCDPCVAALCETQGRVTRRRFYASLSPSLPLYQSGMDTMEE